VTATGRAAGVLQGGADAVQGVKHEARSGDRDHEPGGREAAAHERWAAGLPARNQFERDHFRQLEAEVTAGRMYLDRVAEQAAAVEASRQVQAAEAEAGS
jgi:hypothetical protein